MVREVDLDNYIEVGGGILPSRVCAACGSGLSVKDACGKPAHTHIAWYIEDNGNLALSFLCIEHAKVTLPNAEYWMWHEVGPECGMPGSVWRQCDNRCIVHNTLEPKDAEQEQEIDDLEPIGPLHPLLVP
jgi:hypothetical protein